MVNDFVNRHLTGTSKEGECGVLGVFTRNIEWIYLFFCRVPGVWVNKDKLEVLSDKIYIVTSEA